MNNGNTAPEKPQVNALVIALLAACLVSVVAISGESLWIDEGGSAFKAMQPTFSAWWHAMRQDPSTNLQLPLYLLLLWGWEKFAGSGEIALRAMNGPFLLLTVYGFWLAFRNHRARFWFAILFLLTSAFTWYYLNEARPYVVFLAGGTLLFAAVYRLKESAEDFNGGWAWLFVSGALMVSATSMIAVPWAACAFLAAWYLRGVKFPIEFLRRFPAQLIVLAAGLAALGAYYLFSLHNRTGKPTPGHTGVVNLAFIAYELFGASGLGPSRNVMRVEMLKSFHGYYAPLGVFAGLWLLAVLCLPRAPLNQSTKRNIVVYSVFLFPVIIVMALGHVQGARILPRHVTPAICVIICLGSYIGAKLWSRGLAFRGIVAALLLVSFTSGLELRFAPRHAKDDYRSATTVAKKDVAGGKTIFWAADVQTAIYYGLLKPDEFDSGSARVGIEGTPAQTNLASDDVIALSKTDLYDGSGEIRDLLHRNHYVPTEKFESFQFWRKPGDQK